MALTVSSDTRSAVTGLFGSQALIDLTNPADDDATSADWDVVGYAMENLIARFSERGVTFTQSSGIIRAKWFLCLWDFQQTAEGRAELAELLNTHRGASQAPVTDGAAQGDDDDADRPWLFSEAQIDTLQALGKASGNRSPRGLR